MQTVKTFKTDDERRAFTHGQLDAALGIKKNDGLQAIDPNWHHSRGRSKVGLAYLQGRCWAGEQREQS